MHSELLHTCVNLTLFTRTSCFIRSIFDRLECKNARSGAGTDGDILFAPWTSTRKRLPKSKTRQKKALYDSYFGSHSVPDAMDEVEPGNVNCPLSQAFQELHSTTGSSHINLHSHRWISHAILPRLATPKTNLQGIRKSLTTKHPASFSTVEAKCGRRAKRAVARRTAESGI